MAPLVERDHLGSARAAAGCARSCFRARPASGARTRAPVRRETTQAVHHVIDFVAVAVAQDEWLRRRGSDPALSSEQQAASCPAGVGASAGSSTRQASNASGQRGWKRQPLGMRTASGVSPRSTGRLCRSRGSRRGTTERSALRVGCCGSATTSRGGAFLDDAAEVHDRDAVGEVGGRREVVRDHQDREALALSASSSDRTPARTETSSIETGSSATSSPARARAPPRSRRAGAGRPRARAGSGRGRARAASARRASSASRTRASRSAFEPPSRGSRAAPRRLAGRGSAGRATRTDPGRSSGSAGAAAAARARRGRQVAALEADRAGLRRRRAASPLRGRRLAAARLADERDHLAAPRPRTRRRRPRAPPAAACA